MVDPVATRSPEYTSDNANLQPLSDRRAAVGALLHPLRAGPASALAEWAPSLKRETDAYSFDRFIAAIKTRYTPHTRRHVLSHPTTGKTLS